MNQEQFEKVRTQDGFIAALDQSGGSTPKALRLYGIPESEYSVHHPAKPGSGRKENVVP